MKITELPDNFRPAKSSDDTANELPNQDRKIQFAYWLPYYQKSKH